MNALPEAALRKEPPTRVSPPVRRLTPDEITMLFDRNIITRSEARAMLGVGEESS